MNRRTYLRKATAALAVAGLLLLGNTPVGAWGGHPVNQHIDYYMPGPPPGSWLSACIVQSGMLKYQIRDMVTFYVYDNAASDCDGGIVRGIFWDDTLDEPVYGDPDPNFTDPSAVALVFGQTGQPVLGGDFIAENIYGYVVGWNAGVF